MSKTHGVLAIGLALCLLMAAPVLAQQGDGPNLWGLDGDVDSDGQVGATDVQHVINRALGLQTEDPNASIRPMHRYVLASPRVALAPVRNAAVDGAELVELPCAVIGATENFARPDGRIMVRLGNQVTFALDKNIEGVWYRGACGLMSSQLLLEMTVPPEDGVTEEPVWELIGRDGARGERCGPRVGTARIAVQHRFNEAGDFLIRARIRTEAIPGPVEPDPNGNDDPAVLEKQTEGETEPEVLPCGSAIAFDEVMVRVRVVAVDPTQAQVRDWQDVPDDVMNIHGEAIPHGNGNAGPPDDRGQN